MLRLSTTKVSMQEIMLKRILFAYKHQTLILLTIQGLWWLRNTQDSKYGWSSLQISAK